MALIKHRPKIRALLPRVVHPGQTFRGTVVLEARREVPLEQVAVRLLGNERSVVGSGKQTTRTSRELVRQGVVLSRARKLPPGSTRFELAFELPGELPPSFSGRRATVEYTLRVEAPIRWWPDARADFLVQVVPAPLGEVAQTPRLYASDPAGPRGREQHLECSLATDAILPGGVLRGSVALHNVAYHRYRELQLSFVATERAFTKNRRRSSSDQRECYSARIPLEDPSEGAALPFSLTLPEQARPSAQSALWCYEWMLEVRIEIPWARDLVLKVPLTVLPVGSTARRVVAAPPVVGSERVQAIWSEVAAEQGLRFDGERLLGALGEVELSIARQHRGGAGIFLCGGLSWPSLGLMLDGGRRSGFRRLFHGREVELDDPTWSKTHYLTGREAAQVRALGLALIPQLASLEGLVDLDDQGLRVERRDSGQTRTALSELAAGLRRMAPALEAARAEIPPPTLMGEAVERWTALATELGGRLERGPMAVFGGTIDGLAAEVVTDWTSDGTPQKTRASVKPALPIASERQLDWLAGGGELLPPTGALPTDAAVLVQELAEQTRSIAVREDRIEVALEAPLLDPASVAPILRKLATLAGLLGPRGGPYR